MNLFTITLSREGREPLYQQLYRHIADEIRAGRLGSGERLPSKKAISAHLQVSQNTVETAYALLVQEGYVYSRPKSGFYVSKIEGLVPPMPSAPAEPAPREERPVFRYDFRTNAVDAQSFPYKTWAKLSREVLTSHPDLLSAGEAQGDYDLRVALCKYLHEFRGVQCQPDQMVIGAGIEYLLTLLCQLLDSPRFAVEDPGYKKAAGLLGNSGGELAYISLDQEGMPPKRLEQSGASVAYITPSHQFPTGIIMPIGRRIQLLQWAAQSPGRYIIEDDYNSEFTFSGKPIPAVQGLDRLGKVIYMSTFSRTLAPSFRIAYMVLPTELAKRFRARFAGYASTVSRFEQHTLLSFIEGGYLGRHLNRVKNIYRKRRAFLEERLAGYAIPGGITITGERAGLHLLVTVSPATAKRVMARAQQENIRLFRVSDYVETGRTRGTNTLILGYAGMDEARLGHALDLLFG